MIPLEVREAIDRLRENFSPLRTARAIHFDAILLADYIASTQESITVGRSDGSTESVSVPSHVSPGQHLAAAERLLDKRGLEGGAHRVQAATAHALIALTKQMITDNIYVRAEVQR